MQPIEHEADLLERVAYFKKIKLSELTSAILTCFTIRACLSLGIPQIRKYMKRLLNTLRRGTTGKQKGVILLKDLAYFQGQESVWKSFEDVHTEADLDLLLAGKLDITKLDHKRIAEMILQKNN